MQPLLECKMVNANPHSAVLPGGGYDRRRGSCGLLQVEGPAEPAQVSEKEQCEILEGEAFPLQENFLPLAERQEVHHKIQAKNVEFICLLCTWWGPATSQPGVGWDLTAEQLGSTAYWSSGLTVLLDVYHPKSRAKNCHFICFRPFTRPGSNKM